MSAANAMYRHRYGWVPRHRGPSGDIGDRVARAMFGQDFDASEVPEFDDEPLFPTDPNNPSSDIPSPVDAAVQIFLAQVKNAIPHLVAYDVRGGKDSSGNGYAKLTIEAHDPRGFLQKTAGWALKAAGMNHVSVTARPVALTPGRVVLVFYKGPPPSASTIDQIGPDAP